MDVKMERHYGADVMVNTKTDPIRREECLCLHCSKMTYDKATNCIIAQRMYETACEFDCAMMMTRCQRFVEKQV